MYHIADGSFVDNPIKRYSIGDRTRGLTRAADGSKKATATQERPRARTVQRPMGASAAEAAPT
jgi:hypothetical protein